MQTDVHPHRTPVEPSL